MKVEAAKVLTVGLPITITLETQEEADAFALLGVRRTFVSAAALKDVVYPVSVTASQVEAVLRNLYALLNEGNQRLARVWASEVK